MCRPPYGRIDSVGLAVCASLRYEVMLWSKGSPAAAHAPDVNETVRRAFPGSIILAHDGGPSRTPRSCGNSTVWSGR